MEKRTFLKTSSLLVGGTILSHFQACTPNNSKENISGEGNEPLKNWAGNLKYSTGNVHYPKTVEEVQEIVKNAIN